MPQLFFTLIFCPFLAARSNSRNVRNMFYRINIFAHFQSQLASLHVRAIFQVKYFLLIFSHEGQLYKCQNHVLQIYFLPIFICVFEHFKQGRTTLKIWCVFFLPFLIASQRHSLPKVVSKYTQKRFLIPYCVSCLYVKWAEYKSGKSISVKRCYCLAPANERVYRLVAFAPKIAARSPFKNFASPLSAPMGDAKDANYQTSSSSVTIHRC